MTEHIQDLHRCTPRQTKRFITRSIEAGLVPFVRSSPGMGKSALFRGVANEFELELLDERLSTRSPVDLAGFPHIENGEASFVPFNTYPTIHRQVPKGKQGWLLFLDEFNSGSKATQAAAYKLILDRMVGLTPLHEYVAIGCAGNLATDRAIVNDLSTAMQSRLVHIEMTISFREWLEDVAITENYDERIIGYLNYKSGDLMDFRPEHNEKTFCCPRTWEFMNKLISGRQVVEEDTPLYAGTITSGVAVGFVQFCQVYMNLVTIREILRDPSGAPVPMDKPSQWAVISHLLDKVTDKNFADLCTYVHRFSIDFEVLFFRSALVRHPHLRNHPSFAKVAVEISRYLNGE